MPNLTTTQVADSTNAGHGNSQLPGLTSVISSWAQAQNLTGNYGKAIYGNLASVASLIGRLTP